MKLFNLRVFIQCCLLLMGSCFLVAAVQAEILDSNISCSDFNDPSSCSSDNSEVNDAGMLQAANTMMHLLVLGGDQTPAGCVENMGSYDCDVSPDQSNPLILSCTPDFPNNVASCVARDLNSPSAVLMSCTSDSCTNSLDTELLCSEDQSLCESLLTSEKYCELGFCEAPPSGTVINPDSGDGEVSGKPTDANGQTLAEIIAVMHTLPGNLGEVAQTLAACIQRDDAAGTNTLCGAMETALLNGNVDGVIQLIQSLTPQKLDVSLDASSLAFQQTLTTIQSHLYRMRMARDNSDNSTESTAQLYFSNGQWLYAGTLLAANDDFSNDNYATDAMPATMQVEQNISQDGRLALFVSAAFVDAEESRSEFESQSDTAYSQLTVGIDYRFTNDIFAGFALNYADSDTDFDGGKKQSSELQVQNVSLNTFASIYFGQWYIDGSLLFSQDDYEQQRQVTCVQASCPIVIDEAYAGEFSGSQLGASLSAGYDFVFNAFSVTPFGQYNVGQLKTDAYTETTKATGVGALHIEEQTRDISDLSLGTYFRYVFSTESGVFIPMARLTYSQNLQDDADAIGGYFAADPTQQSFSLQSNDVDKSYFVVAGGLTFQLKNGNSGFVEIESLEGYDHVEQLRYTAGWRWEL